MAPSVIEPVTENHDTTTTKKWQPTQFSSRNIPTFLQTPYKNLVSYRAIQQKKKKAKEVTSVGGTTAFARTLMMQSLYLFYRTPIKVLKKFAAYSFSSFNDPRTFSYFDH